MKRKSPEWLSVMGRIYEIVGIHSSIDSDEEIQALVEVKKQSLDALIADCRTKEYMSSPTSKMQRMTFSQESRTSSKANRPAGSNGFFEPST